MVQGEADCIHEVEALQDAVRSATGTIAMREMHLVWGEEGNGTGAQETLLTIESEDLRRVAATVPDRLCLETRGIHETSCQEI